jgi:TolA-binding protein
MAETVPPSAGTDGLLPISRPSQADFGAPEVPAIAPRVASTLAEETRLLDGAFAALAAGDRGRASQLIQEHEARYPNGLLQKERERARLRLSELSRGE